MFGAREASWPLIRHDLGLGYAEIGLVLSVPTAASAIAEPIIGVFGDTGWRRSMILGGGLTFAACLLLFAWSQGFWILLIASMTLYPASGAFVSLSQASLMDAQPDRRERNMLRWTAAGGLGAMAGPLALAALIALGLGWRPLFAAFALCALPAVALLSTQLGRDHRQDGHESLREGLRTALRQLRRGAVLRWLVMLDASDLLLDVLLGYLGVYLVDVAGASTSEGALAVGLWTAAGLLGNLALLPVLARLDGLRYLRASALAALVVFPLVLLAPGLGPKLALLVVLALVNAGWYPVLQARLYAELPDRSGTVMAVGSIFGTVAAVLPLIIGLVAQRAGLHVALWLLMLGPLVILIGLTGVPTGEPETQVSE